MPVVQLARMVEVFINPEKYKGKRCTWRSNPVKLDETWVERLKWRTDEIKRDYREVMTEMQTGVIGQMSDIGVTSRH